MRTELRLQQGDVFHPRPRPQFSSPFAVFGGQTQHLAKIGGSILDFLPDEGGGSWLHVHMTSIGQRGCGLRTEFRFLLKAPHIGPAL